MQLSKNILSTTLLLSLLACSGSDGGEQGDAAASPDAGLPYGFITESIAIGDPDFLRYKAESMALTEDGETLVYCTVGGTNGARVGFVSTSNFTLQKEIDLHDHSEDFDFTSRCRVSIIEGHAYASYPTREAIEDSAAFVVKLSLANQNVARLWTVPEGLYSEYSSTPGIRGIQVTSADPNRAVFNVTRPRDRQGGLPQGISAVFLDLTTGVFTEKVIVETPPVDYIETYALVGGNKLYGRIDLKDEPGSSQFVANIDTGERISETFISSQVTLNVHDGRNQVMAMDTPAAGWLIADMNTGNIIKRYEYITGGFTPYATWLPNTDRIVHIANSSGTDATMTIVNESDGSFVADLVIESPSGLGHNGVIASADGKNIYLGAGGKIVKVIVPDDL